MLMTKIVEERLENRNKYLMGLAENMYLYRLLVFRNSFCVYRGDCSEELY